MRKESRLKNGRAAFTLIELLVVVAVLALLISILLPALGRARRQANAVACLANLRGIGQNLIIYAQDFDGTVPPPQRSLVSGLTMEWQESLYQYNTGRVLTATDIDPNAQHSFLYKTNFICPQAASDAGSREFIPYGYGINADLPNGGNSSIIPGPAIPYMFYKKLNSVKTGSQTLLAADASFSYVYIENAGNKHSITSPGISPSVVLDVAAQSNAQNRHSKAVNAVMCDGSASPRQWIDNSADIPMPSPVPMNASSNPGQLDPAVQIFWFGLNF